MEMTFSEALGWAGSLSYVAAYLLLSLKKISADRPLYHLMNLVGAAGLILNGLAMRDFPSVAVNIAWMCIGLMALFMIAGRMRDPSG